MSNKECVGAFEASYIIESLGEHIASLRKIEGHERAIKHMEKVKSAIREVIDQSDIQRDKICFVLKRG